MQNHREELYEDGNYQEHLNQEEIRNEEFFEEMPVFEARWIVICMVVVAPLWIWPFEFPAIFAEFGISILKAVGWLVGLATVVFLGSVTLSSIGDALLKGSHRQQ